MLRILVVDDDADCRDVVIDALSDLYEIEQAHDGVEGKSKAIEIKPDLILLDLMMPREDGLMTLRKLKSNAVTKEIPVIMLTALSQDQLTVDCLDGGASDYISKPFSNQVLRSRIQAVLRESREASESGRLIAVLGAKGGVGATTLAVNVGASLAADRNKVVMAEIACGIGCAATLLGISAESCRLQINRETVKELKKHLVKHLSGLLFVPLSPKREASFEWDVPVSESFVEQATAAAGYVVADLPRNDCIARDILLRAADRVVVVSEKEPLGIKAAEETLNQLRDLGIADSGISFAMVLRSVMSRPPAGNHDLDYLLQNHHVVVVPPTTDFCASCVEAGNPAVCVDAKHEVSLAYGDLAHYVAGGLAPQLPQQA